MTLSMLLSVAAIYSLVMSSVAGIMVVSKTDAYPRALRMKEGPAQRCYSFDCLDYVPRVFNWELQDVSWVVFFEGSRCTGSQFKMPGAAGVIDQDYPARALTFHFSSFMVMESGMYPTRGLVQACNYRESAMLNATKAEQSHGV